MQNGKIIINVILIVLSLAICVIIITNFIISEKYTAYVQRIGNTLMALHNDFYKYKNSEKNPDKAIQCGLQIIEFYKNEFGYEIDIKINEYDVDEMDKMLNKHAYIGFQYITEKTKLYKEYLRISDIVKMVLFALLGIIVIYKLIKRFKERRIFENIPKNSFK